MTFSMNLLPGIIRCVMAFAAKCLNVAGKQTAMDTIVRGMAGQAFHPLKRGVKKFFTESYVDILLVAHLAKTDLLRFFGRRPQHTGFIGAVGIVTIPALPIRDREMHRTLAVFLFQVGVATVTQLGSGVLKNKLLRKTVTFMATLTVFFFDRLMSDLQAGILILSLLVAIIARFGGPC